MHYSLQSQVSRENKIKLSFRHTLMYYSTTQGRTVLFFSINTAALTQKYSASQIGLLRFLISKLHLSQSFHKSSPSVHILVCAFSPVFLDLFYALLSLDCRFKTSFVILYSAVSVYTKSTAYFWCHPCLFITFSI